MNPGMAQPVLWAGLPGEVVSLIARTVNGLDALHFCAVNHAFHLEQPKLEVLVLGGYTKRVLSVHPFNEREDHPLRVAVEDGEAGLTVRMPDGIRGLRIIEQIGERHGAELKKLCVALPREAVRADLLPRPQLGSTLTDLRELHLLHRQPGTYDDDDDAEFPGEDYNDPRATDGGDRLASVTQLITSAAKTLQVLDLDCCEYMDSTDVTPLLKLLRPDMKSLVLDLTPFRWRSNQSSRPPSC